MSLKVYIHVKHLPDYPEKTSKIQIPKTWSTKTVRDVINLFAKGYNDKNVETQIDVDNVHFALEDGSKIYSDDVVR